VSLGRTILISALSGCVWAVIAHFLVGDMAGIEGAFAVSPVIGVIVGLATRGSRSRSIRGRALVSLLGLYLAVALFGLAVGITDVATNPNSGTGWHRNPGAVALQAVIGCVWGVTAAGWVVFLWPLAYGNVLLVEGRDAKDLWPPGR
jgi:CBS-domain-containing membrane protein